MVKFFVANTSGKFRYYNTQTKEWSNDASSASLMPLIVAKAVVEELRPLLARYYPVKVDR